MVQQKSPAQRQGFSVGAVPKLRGMNVHGFFLFWPFDRELDPARHQRKERMVSAHADIGPRMNWRSPLAHDDAARVDELAAIRFDAEALGLRVPAIARA